MLPPRCRLVLAGDTNMRNAENAAGALRWGEGALRRVVRASFCCAALRCAALAKPHRAVLRCAGLDRAALRPPRCPQPQRCVVAIRRCASFPHPARPHRPPAVEGLGLTDAFRQLGSPADANFTWWAPGRGRPGGRGAWLPTGEGAACARLPASCADALLLPPPAPMLIGRNTRQNLYYGPDTRQYNARCERRAAPGWDAGGGLLG